MEQAHLWQILMVVILGGIFVFLLLVLLPLVNQLRKTAHQLEITATTLDHLLNNELKALLKRGGEVMEEFEEISPLVKEKLNAIPAGAAQFAFTGMGGHIARVFVFWILKQGWKKIRGKKKGQSH